MNVDAGFGGYGVGRGVCLAGEDIGSILLSFVIDKFLGILTCFWATRGVELVEGGVGN